MIGPEVKHFNADPIRIKQILLNLVGNATKFTQNGTVSIGVEQTDQNLIFKIRDTGIGMTPEQQKDLFRDFKQVNMDAARKLGGTGLGLSISRRLCDLMDGNIAVQSTFGEGSLFTVTFPVTGDETKPEAKELAVERVELDRVETIINGPILVIDDNPIQRKLLKEILNNDGYRVVEAANGTIGIRLAGQVNPAAVILDIMMPDINGWDVLTQLKQNPITQNIPVILASVLEEGASGIDFGAADFLLKPTNPHKLLHVIKKFSRSGNEVLVVDDQKPARTLIRKTLEQDGWRVVEAADGKQAIASLSQSMPDFIILDIMMPKLNGFEVLEKLREDKTWAAIPVLIMTAKNLTREEKAYLQNGTFGIFNKGQSSASGLLTRLREVIAHTTAQ